MAAAVWAVYESIYGGLLETDFYPLHYYIWPGFTLSSEIAALESHVAFFETNRGTAWQGPKNYWLTEYGMPCWDYTISEAELLSAMNGFTGYLMSNTIGINCWAWWPGLEAALLDESGQKTALGNLYYNLAIGA